MKTFQEAIERAASMPTLVKALSFISLWECERVIPLAHKALLGETKPNPVTGQGWDTCFEFLIRKTIEAWNNQNLDVETETG